MSRPQANSRLIGWMKKPRLERGPKLNSAIKHPQMMITSGVRQVPRPEDGLMSPVVTAICFPWTIGARNRQAKCYDELMHLHEKPKGPAVKILAAGQPCKIGECNPEDRREQFGGSQATKTTEAYRFALACSAELCAASASLAENAAVSAAVPQLGESLPLPQARGR